MSILKDYHLCEDLTRLNHQDYFHSSFATPELAEALTSPLSPQEQRRNLSIYLINLSHTQGKSVFVVLKWLLVGHSILRHANMKVTREMGEAIGRMEQVSTTGKYEGYLVKKLFKPYKKYLQKMCLMLQAQNNSKGIQKWFMKYNLMQYLLADLCPSLVEFTPFLLEYYPFLGEIAIQIGLDASRFISQLKNDYKTQDKKLVARQQIEEMEQQYGKMKNYLPEASNQSLTFTDSQCCHGKIINFFQSASKAQGKVLF